MHNSGFADTDGLAEDEVLDALLLVVLIGKVEDAFVGDFEDAVV